MRLAELALKLLGLSKVVYNWLELLDSLDEKRREGISRYADEIAASLGRAAALLSAVNEQRSAVAENPDDPLAITGSTGPALAREMGRIARYVEDIVTLLESQLDGRKLAGVKRRLETMAAFAAVQPNNGSGLPPAQLLTRINRLSEAEGYFRALADGLRV